MLYHGVLYFYLKWTIFVANGVIWSKITTNNSNSELVLLTLVAQSYENGSGDSCNRYGVRREELWIIISKIIKKVLLWMLSKLQQILFINLSLTILTVKTCFIQFSTRVAGWLLLIPLVCIHNQWSLIKHSIIPCYKYRCLKNVMHQIDSKNEWLLLPASFTAKFGLVFVLTLEIAFR